MKVINRRDWPTYTPKEHYWLPVVSLNQYNFSYLIDRVNELIENVNTLEHKLAQKDKQ